MLVEVGVLVLLFLASLASVFRVAAVCNVSTMLHSQELTQRRPSIADHTLHGRLPLAARRPVAAAVQLFANAVAFVGVSALLMGHSLTSLTSLLERGERGETTSRFVYSGRADRASVSRAIRMTRSQAGPSDGKGLFLQPQRLRTSRRG